MWGKKVPYVCFCRIPLVSALFSFLTRGNQVVFKSHLQLCKFCQLVPSSFMLYASMSKKCKGRWASDNCGSHFPLLCFAAAEKTQSHVHDFFRETDNNPERCGFLYNKPTWMRFGPGLRDETFSLSVAHLRRFGGQNVGCSR